MIKKIINQILRKRHYWRTVSFGELAELYVSRLLTMFALNLINIFAGVYLYKLGYSVAFIGLFYIASHTLRALVTPLGAKYIAKFGPKHAILVAAILHIPAFVAFAFVESYGLLAIVLFGVFQKVSGAIYDLAYFVDFSKVKHREHAGKELGAMHILEKVAKFIAPLIGGVVASVFSPQITIIAAAVAFVIAALPLLRTAEPISLGLEVSYRSIPWRKWLPSIISYSALGNGYEMGVLVWGLFLTIAVFSDTNQDIYAIIGALSSLSILISIVVTRIYGVMIDRRRGKQLLTLGAVGNSLMFVVRPFVTTALGVVLLKVLIEISASASRMSLQRVTFDIADSSGRRIVYASLLYVANSVGAILACITLVAAVALFGVQYGLVVTFFVAAMYELLLLLSRRYF